MFLSLRLGLELQENVRDVHCFATKIAQLLRKVENVTETNAFQISSPDPGDGTNELNWTISKTNIVPWLKYEKKENLDSHKK